MSYTFELGTKVNPNIKLNSEQIPERYVVSPRDAILRLVGTDIEQVSEPEGRITNAAANLVGLAHIAFAEHRHMILDPDTVWLTIEKGLAIHITENAEALREQFVKHKGKKFIEIQRNHFVRGQKNDWEGCFDEFSEKIGGEIGDNKRQLIVSEFSTTGVLQRVSSEIMLMDAMSSYFDYGVQTCCSIPLVTLEGTVEDWENIRDRARAISEFDLAWWIDELLPVLDQLVETAKGNPDLDFWVSWYKEDGGSGGPYINGHVQKFFPYLDTYKKYERNTFAHKYNGPTMDKFAKGISQVPFVWDYYETKYPMEFMGGLIGIAQDDTGAVRGAFGWAVKDSDVKLEQFALEKMSKDMVIHHKDGDRGLLKKADAEQWGDEDRKLCEVEILWDKKGLQTHRRYDLHDLFVKAPSTGEPING